MFWGPGLVCAKHLPITCISKPPLKSACRYCMNLILYQFRGMDTEYKDTALYCVPPVVCLSQYCLLSVAAGVPTLRLVSFTSSVT